MTCDKNINITIIGGTRGLGKWIAEKLKQDGFNITITSRNKISGSKVAKKIDVNYSDNNIESIKDADIIIFSVPIEYMIQTIKEVAPNAPENSLLMDVTSVKTEPAQALKEYAPRNTEILPCHPMFGPRVPSIEGQSIILTPVEDRCELWFDKVYQYLKKQDAHIVISTPEEHDKTMSVVQGLTHFSYIAIASTIRKLNISVKKSREFASPVYSLMLDMISRIVSQNPYLYYSIQKSNKQTAISRKILVEECERLAKLIDENNEQEFVEDMSDSAKHLDEYEEALGRSDKAISSLTHDLNVIKSSIGKEKGFEHQYSKKIHIGIIQSMDADTVTIKNLRDKIITLKISNINILSDEETYEWKKKHLKQYMFDVSVVLPCTSDENILLDLLNSIDEVIDIHVKDIYLGKQIKEGYKSITFNYTTFSKEDRFIVEKYLIGIGGSIR
ncbi:prephenate dehydrogenase [Methanosphaera sp. WGK6]|uniref:prephenate dehydrogenase n=1 Tax=Methanosphaera sp. WGK6 TaxID=1561964 RepID=UPI00084C6CC3|nr:prephenate dehydrogenase [Methanosphaera sp. WGK6]OED30507.1 prephenate dehydrogenase [Methanosphaera sp. WGK6]